MTWHRTSELCPEVDCFVKVRLLGGKEIVAFYQADEDSDRWLMDGKEFSQDRISEWAYFDEDSRKEFLGA